MLYNISHSKIKGLYRAIMLVVIGFLLLSTSFIPKTTQASNNYIENIVFYKDANGIVRVRFRVKTSFDITIGPIVNYGQNECSVAGGAYFGLITGPTGGYEYQYQIIPHENISEAFTCDRTQSYTAGQTYNNIVVITTVIYLETGTDKICMGQCPAGYNKNYIAKFGTSPTATAYTTQIFEAAYGQYPKNVDTEEYYFIEYPSLTITYPLNNAEIAEAFFITGSYSVPDLESYSRLYIWLQYQNLDIYPFVKTLDAVSGTLNERIAGLPAGNYNIRFVFADGTKGLYEVSAKIPISIVEAIPPELPETEEPESPFFNIIEGQIYYSSFSNYPTSTNLYNSLINTIQPVMSAIGNNLNYFGDKFNQDNAKDTGEKTGKAVLLIRSYTNNLNSFFSDLPVSQFLLFYLILLMASIVFRIIRTLINLIKP